MGATGWITLGGILIGCGIVALIVSQCVLMHWYKK